MTKTLLWSLAVSVGAGTVLFIVANRLCGCGYDAALTSCDHNIPVAESMTIAFDERKSHISYFTGIAGRPSWNGYAPLHERYVLEVKVPISLGVLRRGVVSSGDPSIFVRELEPITKLPDGGLMIASGASWRLTPEQLRLVAENGGDFSVIGIELVTDRPVENFDAYWRGR
jgi:hypothetical protein